MRVLVIDEEIPYPLNSGKRLRTFNLLKPLASRHEITFLCRSHEQCAEANMLALRANGICAEIVPDPIRKKQGPTFYFALLANLFSRYPYSVSSHYSPKMIARLGALLNEGHYDLLHCEWTPYAINMHPWLEKMPTLVDAHNIEAMIWKRNFQVEQHPLKKAFLYTQWRKMEMFEQLFFPRFSQCVFVSWQDAEQVAAKVASSRVEVVDNGVDSTYFARQNALPQIGHTAPRLVFTGSLDWRPNVDGLLYFLEQIFPLIKLQYPQIRLTIVGRNPLPILQNKVAAMADVVLTGTVDDVRPFMEEAHVYIVPLRVGGGSRLKILEAFSMQMPVVSTSVGAEGLLVSAEENIVLADTPEAFAAAVISILEDPVKANRLGTRGRRLVEEKYQWQALANRLEDCWFRAVNNWQQYS